MTSLGIRQDLWLQASRNNKDAFHVPEAPYVLKASKWKLVIEVIRSIKTPSNYLATLQSFWQMGNCDT
jgi:hypothetical protein